MDIGQAEEYDTESHTENKENKGTLEIFEGL